MQMLTPDAQQHLDRYLQVVRLSLRGTGLEATEVVADVREHIATALEGEEAPVARPMLERVLERLGPPAVWVPDEEAAGMETHGPAARPGARGLAAGLSLLRPVRPLDRDGADWRCRVRRRRLFPGARRARGRA